MSKSLPAALVFAFVAALGLAACGDDAEQAGGETPEENISEAEPEGVGGTSNQ